MSDHTMIKCGGCGIDYYVPDHWLEDKKKTGEGFRCPNGCDRCFEIGEPTVEVDRLKANVKSLRQIIENLRRDVRCYAKQTKRLINSRDSYKGHYHRVKREMERR